MRDVQEYEKVKQLKKQVTDYETDFQFYSQFVLSPEIDEFTHLDKNLVITNLNGRLREPERLRVYMDALHILLRYGKRMPETNIVGFDDNGKAIKETRLNFKPQHPRSTRFYIARYRSFITTAAARGGYLFKELNTKRFRSSEAVEDRTKIKPRFADKAWSKNRRQESEDDF